MQNQTQYYDTVPLEYRKLSGWMIFFIVTQVLGMFSNLNSTLSFLRSGASLWVFFTLLVIVLQVLMLIFLGTRRREFCYFYYAIGAVNIFLFFLRTFPSYLYSSSVGYWFSPHGASTFINPPA